MRFRSQKARSLSVLSLPPKDDELPNKMTRTPSESDLKDLSFSKKRPLSRSLSGLPPISVEEGEEEEGGDVESGSAFGFRVG